MIAGRTAIFPRATHVCFAAHVCIRADGGYLRARSIRVSSGATPGGRTSLRGFQVGSRDSPKRWRELLVGVTARGLAIAPEAAVGDGAPGVWTAVGEVFPGTRHQRCRFHKSSNVLNTFPKSIAPAVTSDLQDIHHAGTKAAALAAIAVFTEKYRARYAPAVTCLTRDTGALLTFLDVPAEHRDHLRTSDPVESVFATVRHRAAFRHRTLRPKRALSQKNRDADGLHPRAGCGEEMTPPEGCKSGATRHRRRQIQQWARRLRSRQNQRRLIRPRHPKSGITPPCAGCCGRSAELAAALGRRGSSIGKYHGVS